MQRLKHLFQTLTLVFILLLSRESVCQDYRYESWQSSDGLPQNSVKRIVQDNDGYLWLSTEGGLSKFDGITFTNFGMKSDSIFKSNRTGNLFHFDNGDIVFWNYLGGLMLKRKNEFINLLNKIPGQDNRLRKIYRCAKGKLLLEYYTEGYDILDAHTYEPIKTKISIPEIPIQTLSFEAYNIWVYDSHIELRDHDFNLLPEQLDLNLEFPVSLAYDKSTESFWACNSTKLKQFKDLKLINSYSLPIDITEKTKNRVFIQNGHVYLCNYETLNVYSLNQKTDKFQPYSSIKNICPEGAILNLFLDQEENFWVGTSTCGLIKIKPSRTSYLDDSRWDIKKNFYPIEKDKSGNIYIGVRENGVLIIDTFGNRIHSSAFDIVKDKAVNSLQFHDDTLYLSCYKENFIWKKTGEILTKIYFPDSIHSQKNAIFSSSSGRLLVPSHDGYLELVNNKFVSHTILKNEALGFVSYFKETSDGKLWISSADMLLAIDQETNAILFDSRESLPHILSYREVYEDSEGRLFVGTYGHGFVVIDNDNLYHFDEDDGLIDNTVSTITEDSFGNVWFTGNKGLVRVQKSEILDVMSGNSNRINPVLYNEKTDALRSSEFNGGHQQTKCKLSEDCYVFPSMKGAVVVDFEKMQNSKIPPPILIESLHYNDEIIYPDQEFEIDYTGGRLDIAFTSTSFVSPEQIEFIYKLEGYDEEWVKAGTHRKASYAKLPPGDYTFLVKAKSYENVWSENAASYAMIVVPPFYMETWFRWLLVVLSILATAYIVNFLNSRKRKLIAKRQALQLEAILVTEEKERKRIAADLHDGVGQLLSSVKLNLGVVKDKIKGEKNEESADMVEKSKIAIDEIITEIRNISYNLLPPSLEQFGLAVAISEEVSKLKDNPDLHVHFDHSTMDDKFNPKIEIVLFRVFQELLNNAIKHANASEITIQLIQHEHSLLLMFEDDGDGYNLQKAYRKIDSSGLKNLYSRVKFINGTINVDSQVGKGANTIIEIPI